MNVLHVHPSTTGSGEAPVVDLPATWAVRRADVGTLEAAIESWSPAVVLCSLPGPDLDATLAVCDSASGVPVVVVTSTTDTDLAVHLSRIDGVEYAPVSWLAAASESVADRLATVVGSRGPSATDGTGSSPAAASRSDGDGDPAGLADGHDPDSTASAGIDLLRSLYRSLPSEEGTPRDDLGTVLRRGRRYFRAVGGAVTVDGSGTDGSGFGSTAGAGSPDVALGDAPGAGSTDGARLVASVGAVEPGSDPGSASDGTVDADAIRGLDDLDVDLDRLHDTIGSTLRAADAPAVSGSVDVTVESDGTDDEPVTLGYLAGRIHVNAEPFGTVWFARPTDAAAGRFTTTDERVVELLAGLIGYAVERRRYESELGEARERVDRTLERIDDAFFAVDTNWAFTYVNSTAEELLDRSAADLLGKNVWEQFPEAITDAFYEEYHEAMRTQEPVAFEEYFEPLATWFEVTAYPSVDGLSVFFRDVTERRERQRVRTDLLATSRRLMQAETVERVAEVMSEAAAEVLGLELHMVRLYDPETDQLVPAAGTDDSAADVPDREAYGLDAGPAGEAFRTGEPIVVDNLAAYDDHPAYEASSRGPLAAAMYLPLGEYGTLNATSREQGAFSEEDVQLAELLTTVATAALERADREQTLRRYEQIIETVRGMVYATDATGEVTFVTERLAALLGYDQAELLGVSTRTVIPDDQLATVEAELAALDREPPEGSTPAARESGTRRFEIDLRRADGDRVPVEIEVSALDGPAGGRVGVVRDLSELRTTQQRLDTERERLSYLFEALPDPVVEVRRTDGGETVVTAVNDAFTARFDVDASDVVGRPPDAAILGEGAALLTHLPTVDSTPSDPTAEFDVRTPDGRRYFLFRGAPYTAGGDARGFGILTDVTTLTRRGRHLAVLNRVFRHNFRNELNVVQGYAELLAEGVTDDDLAAHAETVLETTRSLTKLSDTAQRIQTVVDETPADRRALDPAAVVDAAADAAGVSVALDADASVPSVAADDRLELVLTELLENARDHGVEPIEVTIDGAADGTEVRIEVRDHGPGIDDVEWAVVTGDREITQLEHGSGLGLWLATLLVEQYGGELQNRSTDDVTALALVLPAASRRTDGAS